VSTATSWERRGQTKNCAIPTYHNPKKFCPPASAGKVMLTLFWDHQGPLAAEQYTSKGTTVTSASCTSSNLLRNYLRPAVGSEHHGLLSIGVLLLHDNARDDQARSSVFLIHPTRVTSLLVTAISLGHSRRLLVERLSDPRKKCRIRFALN
jgi:hypothetical protein